MGDVRFLSVALMLTYWEKTQILYRKIQKIVRMLGAQNVNTRSQKKQMGYALMFLTRYTQEGDEFLYSFVTGDETWVFHHTPESK
jgi:hypothetical protein